ncbi:hypothetical protein ACTHR6_25935 [Ralstonia holmesii]|uniref:hypothetical protein n=1 Tax=Ralstonia TaxID=48736 RepID=UPI00046A5A81|nr:MULTISPECIES: hypothetical protein [Ralstonia]CAJ0700429.1 hypothetical protein R11007_03289 [Ralstonia sp. LMG 32967]
MLARHKAILGLSLLFLLLLSIYPAFLFARDCYAPSLFPRFYIALAGGVIVATLFAVLDFPKSDTSSKRRIDPVGQFICFALFGAFTTWTWATTIPRFTADRVVTAQAAFEKVRGAKSCHTAVQFVDPGGAGTIKTCASLWNLPSLPEHGTISVTEKVSTLGVYLVKIDLVTPQVPTERQ